MPLLVRLYNAHVVIVPGLIIVLLTLHALLVKRHGISPHPAIPAASHERPEPFTHHLRRVGAFALILLGTVGILAVLRPPGVGPSPIEGIEVTKPPWPFWWMYTLENWFGLPAILWGAGTLFALLVLLPFVDRSPRRGWRERPVVMTVVGLVALGLVVLTVLAAVTGAEQHL